MACHSVWLPILMGSALALSKIKNCLETWTTPHSPAHPMERHSSETNLHHDAKSSVIWDVQSSGASSQEGLLWTDFSWPRRKILRPINIVFDDIWPEWPWIAFFDGDFRRLQFTRHWSISVHDSCVILCHELWRNKLKAFSNSPEVMLFFKPESCFQNFLLSIGGC